MSLPVTEIAFIYRTDTIIFVVDKNEKKYFCDKNLSILETELSQQLFFRVNRKYIVNIDFVRGFKSFEKVKLELFLRIQHPDHKIVISQKMAPLFKRWVSEE